MSYLDTLHRGFKEYRKLSTKDSTCSRERTELVKNNAQLDKFVSTKFYCEIKEDWIDAIEKGLVFVEKAIAEERQFIRSDGETVPIEKAKKVSRTSVEYLGKHSNSITHLPEEEGQPIIPDEIYMVEKLNDYAVYENRFLYLLLVYLRDFISLRLEKIQEIRTTYICDFALTKEIDGKFRSVSYSTSFHEKRKNNPYPLPNENSDVLLERIENSFQFVLMLLNTNLMVEVAKTPLIHPPIVKTNVLKMNNNFKNALAFYDYIVNYEGDGYIPHEVVSNLSPFEENVADEIGEIGALTSFLTYKYGNDLQNSLELAYEEEERQKAEDEKKKLTEQIKRLKKRLEETGQGMEEYILLLEKRNRLLEQDSADLLLIKNEILELNQKIDSLRIEKESLKDEIKQLEKTIEEKIFEIERLNQKYIDDMAALKAQHQEELLNLQSVHEAEIKTLKAEFDEKLDEVNTLHKEEIDEMLERHRREIEEQEIRFNSAQEEYRQKLSDLQTSFSDERANLNNEIRELTEKNRNATAEYENKLSEMSKELAVAMDSRNFFLKEYEAKVKEHEIECQKVIEDVKHDSEASIYQWSLMKAELRAVKIQSGEISNNDDFTSKEKFEELEREYEAFQNFFNRQWKKAKKNIRKSLLGKPAQDLVDRVSKPEEKSAES